MEYSDRMAEVMKVMSSRGILLTAWKNGQQANAMAIGWGMIGSIWSRPVWQVLVRPSRYTYELIEREGIFGVCVMPLALNAAVQHCGTVSGRNGDKLAETGLTAVRGEALGAPVLAQSVIHYECRVVHRNDFLPERMVPDIREGAYPSGDYHRVYWGQIVDARVDEAALGKLFEK